MCLGRKHQTKHTSSSLSVLSEASLVSKLSKNSRNSDYGSSMREKIREVQAMVINESEWFHLKDQRKIKYLLHLYGHLELLVEAFVRLLYSHIIFLHFKISLHKWLFCLERKEIGLACVMKEMN